MPCHVVGDDRDVGVQVFERCIESFVTSLSGRGYCTVTLQQKRAMVTSFARWVRQRRVDVTKIDEAAVGAFLAHLRRRRILIGNWHCTLTAFLEHLRAEGVTARPEQWRDDSQAALILQLYETYLLNERGLTKETVCNYLRFVSPLAREHSSCYGIVRQFGRPRGSRLHP